MSDVKISQLTAVSVPADGDLIPIVDVSDTTDSPSGTTKKIAYSNFGAAGIAVNVAQTSHGLSVGDVIYLSGINTYAKAKADSELTSDVVGIVTVVTDANNFSYTTEGAVTVGVPAVAAGTVLFLSASTAGALTSTAPTTAGYVSVPLATVAQSATKMVFHKYRGMVLGSTSSPATMTTVYTASGTTLSLTTAANDKVVVWAKGDLSTGTGADYVYLKYNGVTKDTVYGGHTSGISGSDSPFALHYTETPGAATQNITVTSSSSIANCVIIAQVISPIQAPITLGTSTKNGIASKDTADASTTQTIAHGLGRIPSRVRFTALYKTSTSNIFYMAGSYDGTNNSSILAIHGTASGSYTSDSSTTYSIQLSDSTNLPSSSGQQGTVTVTSTNVVISWTKVGSPTGTFSFMWEVQ